MAQAAEVNERIRAVPLHRHNAKVAAEVARVAPTDGQSVAKERERGGAQKQEKKNDQSKNGHAARGRTRAK